MEKKSDSMNKIEFIHSLELQPAPPSSLSAELQALWWAKKGDWERAHDLAQDANSRHGDWVHAYLHRVEGDPNNAVYWYARAKEPFFEGDLEDEWTHLLENLIS
jgi:hypothetical protein